MSREWEDVIAPQLKDVIVPSVWYINDKAWRRSMLDLCTNDKDSYYEVFKMIDPSGDYEFNATITRLRKLLIEYTTRANPRTQVEWIEREYNYDPDATGMSSLSLALRKLSRR